MAFITNALPGSALSTDLCVLISYTHILEQLRLVFSSLSSEGRHEEPVSTSEDDEYAAGRTTQI